MALTEYTPGSAFPGRMGRTIEESDPAWPAPQRARPGTPNVLFIVIDDTGFGQLLLMLGKQGGNAGIGEIVSTHFMSFVDQN